ncbi:MAG TPA: secondary thiamine-phosphate synthase enzyme YjbQ [Acidobacteriota bacterium]|nr:secondary thiamine-phosphate synthase enzyme YjbQ [Acidobacteriota bacterium]
MTVETYELSLQTESGCGIVEITGQVQSKVEASGVTKGTVTIFVVGSTGALTTVEYEPGLVKDLKDFYDRIIPPTRDYHHEEMWHDGNGFSHVRASLLKPDLVVPIVGGRLRLGTWQQVVLINFDNKARRREVCLQVIGSR